MAVDESPEIRIAGNFTGAAAIRAVGRVTAAVVIVTD
jgi:hypothetical protein